MPMICLSWAALLGLLVHFQVEDRFEVFQRALHLRIAAQLAADHPRLQTLLDMGQVLLVLGVQLFSLPR